MTNAERRERRRQAGLKAAETRRQTDAEASAQAEDREAKRRENLRFVLDWARRIRRESDLYHHAHVNRWDHHPARWTPAQIEQARQFLHGFIRPDGTPQADPIRRKGRWRL